MEGNTTGNVTLSEHHRARSSCREAAGGGSLPYAASKSKERIGRGADVQYAKIAYTVTYNDPVHSESFVKSIPFIQNLSPNGRQIKINYMLDLSGSLQPIFSQRM